MDWINLSEDDLSSEVTLRLVKDVPITGRVVNTEGRPVAGVLVSIAEICVPPNEKLDAYLLDWHQGISNILNILSSRRKRLFVGLDGISGKATTDKDGRFTLHGAGGERIVHVTFSGGGLAHSTPFVITRNGFDVQPYNAALHKYGSKFMVQERVLGLYPPEFTFIAEAGKTMEGVVKDAASGLPVAGCKVSAATSYAHGTSTVSNAEGKYHLEGLAKRADGHGVLVHPPKSSTYLDGVADQVADTPGLATIRHDFGLVKGVIVSGRVVDKQTGKGVHCTARCLPLPGNKFIGPKQGFDLRYLFPWREIEAGEDGRFRLLTIPGKALLTVWVCERKRFNGELLCEYRQADPDPDHKELFDEDGDTCRVRTADDRVEFLYHANAVKVIDAKENGETRVELSVDWGATVRIVVQDTEGKPLPGVWAAGLADVAGSTYQLPEATATVYALNPVRPRMMVFYHAGKKLGGMATVRGDEKEPIVVKLAPLGKLSGRLVDPDGKSLQGVRMSINPQHENGRALYRWAEPLGKPVYTDKDGRFHIESFVPDLKFWTIFKKENTFFSRESGLDERQIRAGESVDMGTLRVRPST